MVSSPASRDEGCSPGGSREARRSQIDVIVNCCHGGPGEDGSLQGAFDLAGLRYTGPDVAGAAFGMDKLAFFGLASGAGLPVLQRAILDASTATDQLGFAGPFIVKPRFGGSSIGVEVVADLDTAKDLFRRASTSREGRWSSRIRGDLFDLNVAVRSWPSLELSAAERPERATLGSEILGYSDKYVGGEGMASAPRELPARDPRRAARADARGRPARRDARRGPWESLGSTSCPTARSSSG